MPTRFSLSRGFPETVSLELFMLACSPVIIHDAYLVFRLCTVLALMLVELVLFMLAPAIPLMFTRWHSYDLFPCVLWLPTNSMLP